MEEAGAQERPIKLYPDKFENEVVVITGGGQGIGAATARMFAAQGATLVLVDIQQNALTDVSGQIENDTKKRAVTCHVCDVGSEDSVNKLVADIISRHGRIDVLVHVAGIYPFHPLTEYPSDVYHKVINVNLNSSFYVMRAVLPHMQRAGYGRIITVSSGSLFQPVPGVSAYAAAKSGVMGLTKVAATEAGPGVTVNALVPGLIRTDNVWRGGETRQLCDDMLEKQCVKRYGRPDDVAHSICFLASPEAGFITGLSLDVGGGAWFR